MRKATKEASQATKLDSDRVHENKSRIPLHPLEGRAFLLVEDDVLIAMSVESCLLDAGAATVKIAGSTALAKRVLDEGIRFDAAIVDLLLNNEDASPLIEILSELGIPVVVSTGADIDLGHPAFSSAVVFLQKPYNDSDLIEALVEWTGGGLLASSANSRNT
ncbi:response regulator [Methylocapsa sp. D3K7]|uniref:response regulator n=1 Tax=Methylocapsa sp. D3K7 TaxID=3041435 RepID=UPI00244E8B5D|nr:response regulator [Methylocapsa sp. D3K7]WGJ13261.1 response regulator [Methylocapsa sp. D3K7]